MPGIAGLERDLTGLVGEAGLVEPADFDGYEQASRHGAGRARAVVRPASTAEVVRVLRYCYANDLKLVVQGANTGLVSAGTPDTSGDQLVLNLTRLNGVEALDVEGRSAVVAAGARLSDLNSRAGEAGLFFPIDLGADPTIGGMVATNTGGARLIRYGDVRRNLLGVEVVTATEDAAVLSDLRGLRKNNSGLPVTQMIAGSGGGLGIVTRACVNLHRLPRQTATALAILTDHAVLPALIARLEAVAGDFLTACEGMSRNALAAVLRCRPQLRHPFGRNDPPGYVLLIELTASTSSDTGLDLQDLLLQALSQCMEAPGRMLADVLVGRADELWALRHAISDSLKTEGRVIAFDLSLPRARLPEFRSEMTAELDRLYPYLRICDFGHAGDGGDHFNLVWPHEASPSYDPLIVREVRDLVYDRAVNALGGSFSAEHGVGPYNLDYYRRYVTPEDREMAARLKRQFDPKGLLGHFDFS